MFLFFFLNLYSKKQRQIKKKGNRYSYSLNPVTKEQKRDLHETPKRAKIDQTRSKDLLRTNLINF